MYLSYQNTDVVGVWEEVTSLVGIELCHCHLFETVGYIDEMDRKENVSSLFHTGVEFIRLQNEGVKTHRHNWNAKSSHQHLEIIRMVSERITSLRCFVAKTRSPILHSFEHKERQRALDTVAASNHVSKDFQTVLKKWVVEISESLSWKNGNVIMFRNHILHWNATQFRRLIYSKNLALELQFYNLAVASLRLAWNISGMRESELSNNELLDVLSELVLKLSGRDTWKSSTPYNSGTFYNIPFKQCSKWYFIKGVRLLSIHCKKHSAAYCLWVKTCKRYFKSALSIQDEYSESMHDACHVYLSALYYVSGANQETIIKHLMETKNGTSSGSFLKPHALN